MPKTRDDETYEKGVHDGQEAGLLDQFSQNIAKDLPFKTRSEEIYNSGYDYGVRHKSESSRDSDSGSSNSSDCYVSTACVLAAGRPDDCRELELLRAFRDQYVGRLPGGASLISRYYSNAPRILAALNAKPDASAQFQRLFSELVIPTVALIDEGRYEDALALYVRAVTSLEHKYTSKSANTV